MSTPSIAFVVLLLPSILFASGCADPLPAAPPSAQWQWTKSERLRDETRRAAEQKRRRAERAAAERAAFEQAAAQAAEAAAKRAEEAARHAEEEQRRKEEAERDAKQRMGNLVRAAVNESDDGRAADAAAQALALDDTTHELNPNQRRFMQGALFTRLDAAFLAASRSLTEAALAVWIAKKEALALRYAPEPKEFLAKDYHGEFDFAPLFVIVVGYAHCAKGDMGGCRTLTEQARSYKGVRLHDRPRRRAYEELLAKADRALAAFDPYAPGKYVTNEGLFQVWIGRVVARKTGGLRVRVTYALGGGPWSGQRGHVVDVSSSEVKPLTAVSADALVQGYQ